MKELEEWRRQPFRLPPPSTPGSRLCRLIRLVARRSVCTLSASSGSKRSIHRQQHPYFLGPRNRAGQFRPRLDVRPANRLDTAHAATAPLCGKFREPLPDVFDTLREGWLIRGLVRLPEPGVALGSGFPFLIRGLVSDAVADALAKPLCQVSEKTPPRRSAHRPPDYAATGVPCTACGR